MLNGNFNKNKIKSAAKPKLLKINEGNVRKEFEKLHEDGKSLLKADDKYIVFCGLLELTDRSCVHMELRNPTNKTILFNVRTPVSPVFFVKPHVGMVEPGKKVTLYFTFRGKCHRVPSDYCWIYSVYQIVIDETARNWIAEDEFSTSNLRVIWNEKGRGDIQNVLHLSCRFDGSKRAEHDCRKHRIEKQVFLNDTGDVLNTGTLEESRDGATQPNFGGRSVRKPKTPASCDSSELPKTAESQKGGGSKKG